MDETNQNKCLVKEQASTEIRTDKSQPWGAACMESCVNAAWGMAVGTRLSTHLAEGRVMARK